MTLMVLCPRKLLGRLGKGEGVTDGLFHVEQIGYMAIPLYGYVICRALVS